MKKRVVELFAGVGGFRVGLNEVKLGKNGKAIWGYLIYRNLFSFKSFMASLIGLATVGIWLFVLYQLPITNHQLPITNYQSPITNNLSAWIPLGAVLLAWLASAVTRHILQER